MAIDFVTVAALIGVISLIQVLALAIQYYVDRSYPGPGWWTLGATALVGAYALNAVRNYPGLASLATIGNNALFATALALVYTGILRFFGRREKPAWLIGLCVATTLIAAWFTVVNPDPAARYINFSVTHTILYALLVWAVLANKTRFTRVSANFLAAVFLVNALFFAVRALSYLAGVPANSPLGAAIEFSAYIVGMFVGVMWTFGTILMVNQRLSEESREARDNLALIFDTIPDAIQITRMPDGLLVAANSAFERFYGYPRREVIGSTVPNLGIWKNPAERQQWLSELQHGASPASREATYVRCDGSELTGIVSGGIITLQGEPYIISTVHDITQRKRYEAALRDSEERFRLIVQNSPDMIILWDRSGHIEYMSPAFERVLGAGADSAIIGALLQEAVLSCVANPGQLVRNEYAVRTQAGDMRTLDVVLQGFVHSTAGVEVVAIASDVTEQRDLQRMLQDANAVLEQHVVERTAALTVALDDLRRANAGKDAFLAAVSHELRTPLMGILSMGDLLESDATNPLSPSQARFTEMIRQNGQRLLATLNSVLRYTQVMAGARPIETEPCLLADICTSAVSSIWANAQNKQQQISAVVQPPNLQITTDVSALLEILKALLDNAVKFTPEGGHVDVSIIAAPGADRVCLAVTDTGIGMDEDQVASLFRPFTQGDQTLARRFAGLGIDLAYVHKLVELLGGSIVASSKPGMGSCFTITLPLGDD